MIIDTSVAQDIEKKKTFTTAAHVLSSVGIRTQTKLWDWANVQFCIYIFTYIEDISNIFNYVDLALCNYLNKNIGFKEQENKNCKGQYMRKLKVNL